MNAQPIPFAPRVTPPKQTKPTVPLAEREALTLAEAAALGYGCERVLREMIRTGRLNRCVLGVGVRGVRLLRAVLIEELRERN